MPPLEKLGCGGFIAFELRQTYAWAIPLPCQQGGWLIGAGIVMPQHQLHLPVNTDTLLKASCWGVQRYIQRSQGVNHGNVFVFIDVAKL